MANVESIDINDALFCPAHLKEICTECDCDLREENDSFYGFDPAPREGLEAPAAHLNKEGTYECKKHKNPSCTQCFGWKKQITRARVVAKKAAGKKS